MTSNYTTVAVPANVPASQATEVLVEVDHAEIAGCCVQGAVVVNIVFWNGPGSVSVALEAPDPDLTIEILGLASASSYTFNAPPILQGAVAKGVWKIKLLAAPGATGWFATSSTLSLELGQCE